MLRNGQIAAYSVMGRPNTGASPKPKEREVRRQAETRATEVIAARVATALLGERPTHVMAIWDAVGPAARLRPNGASPRIVGSEIVNELDNFGTFSSGL
jgi:hypothetical protein